MIGGFGQRSGIDEEVQRRPPVRRPHDHQLQLRGRLRRSLHNANRVATLRGRQYLEALDGPGSPTIETSGTLVLAAGVQGRFYMTPRYFLLAEGRAEWAEQESSMVWGGGFGFHIGGGR